MNVLFFIDAQGHGSGGHYHSLNHISKELGKGHEIKIISIGMGFSKIIAENPYFLYHFKFNGINILQLFKKINKTIESFRPDIIHFFDMSSYNVLRLNISSKKFRVISNKCGGPNREWPFVNNLILFSQENYEWYTKLPKFRITKISLIPNRVKQLEVNESYKPVSKDPDSFNFVRICRIGEGYKKSIRDSVNLVNYLHGKGHTKVKLYVIGAIEDNNVYNELINETKGNADSVSFLTATHFTKEASLMLYLADAVIGTGRGFMESASLGKPLLAINAEDNYPVLITQNNYSGAFKTNFSQRNIFESYDSDENLRNIEKVILEKEYYRQLSVFSSGLFQKYFSISKAFQAYTEAYENARFGPNGYSRDLIMILKNLYHFTLSGLKRTK
jgi:hypothetical protein